MKKYYYKLIFDNSQYIIGYYTVFEGDNYDYACNEDEYLPEEAGEGWYKFIPGSIEGEGTFVLDQERKEEILEERRKEAEKPTQLDVVEAQATYTALMTDTLLPEEEE